MEKTLKRCLHLRSVLKARAKTDFPLYATLVRDWIRKKKTRPQLDLEVYALLDEPARKTHVDFLVCLSKLCWGLSSLRLETPIALPEPRTVRSEEPVLSRETYNDLTIPSQELIKARLYLSAWDAGLVNVDPKVARLLYYAMKNYIKDILQAAICDKSNSESKSVDSTAIWNALMRTNLDLPRYVSAFPRDDQSFTKTL